MKKIGEKAGKRAIARLNPKKVKSSSVPIIFDPKVSGSLVTLFSGGISGQSIARGTSFLNKTEIGSNCLLMAYVHVAHDCIVGSNTILSNAVQVGGDVEIGNHVIVGGMTPVHQFCKIGDYSFTGGGYRIVQDVPPYIMAMNEPLTYSGLNTVGLRRNNFKKESLQTLKKIYKLIYQSSLNRTQAVKKIQEEFDISKEVKNILDFIENSNRGLI